MATDQSRASQAVRAAQMSVASSQAALHTARQSLAGQFVAFQEGIVDDQSPAIADAADHFGVDPTFARTVEEYLQARRQLRLARFGWRAGFRRGG